MNKEVEFILYVKDQQKSMRFYSEIFSKNPRLDVPEMTEFEISPGVVLGLMTEDGIAKILTGMEHPSKASGISR